MGYWIVTCWSNGCGYDMVLLVIDFGTSSYKFVIADEMKFGLSLYFISFVVIGCHITITIDLLGSNRIGWW